jgi:L,D-transpeptidase ErfK/SrfK
MSLKHKTRNHILLVPLFSSLLLSGCQHWSFTDNPSNQAYYNLDTHNFAIDYEQELIGRLAAVKTEANDTLPDIARHYGLGHNEIISANPNVDPWLPEAGTRVLLPLLFTIPDVPRQGIVLNLANMRMFHFPANQSQKIMTYPVGIGRDGWSTPKGSTRIVSKTKNPVWNVPPSIQREHAAKGDYLPSTVKAGADNPLGEYAMRLAFGNYLIHGTNKPYGVGMQMSHGCLNLYPEDISVLFNNTKVGTPVTIVEQPYLLGWQHEALFLEAHKPLSNKNFKQPLLSRIKYLAKKHRLAVDWKKVEEILARANGIPTPILAGSAGFQQLSDNALLLGHPPQLYGQAQPKPLTANTWSVTATSVRDERTARKLSALLNHQGPIIPTRIIEQDGFYYIVSGPFSSQKEAKSVLKRIRMEFDLDGKINAPQVFSASSSPQRKSTNTLPRLDAPTQEASFFDQWFN